MLQGGRYKTDPRVAQVIEVSRGIFSNEDLGLKSDSDESIADDPCSDPEHQIVSEKKTAVDHVSELQKRSTRTQ